MRETEILRGLGKAKAQCFAEGTASVSPRLAEFRKANPVKKVNAFEQHAKDVAENVAAAKRTATPVQQERPASNPVLDAARRGIVGQALAPRQAANEAAAKFAEGTAFLSGPGSSTSDSIDAKLSAGEAVLPAKTVLAVGAKNLARLIEETNGTPPKGPVQADGEYAAGAVPEQAKSMYSVTKDTIAGGLNKVKEMLPSKAPTSEPSYMKNAPAAAANTIKNIPAPKSAARNIAGVGFALDSAKHWDATGENSGLSNREKGQVVFSDLARAVGTGLGAASGGALGAVGGTAVAPGVGTIAGGAAGGILGATAGARATDDVLGWTRKAANYVNEKMGGAPEYWKPVDDILAREDARKKAIAAEAKPTVKPPVAAVPSESGTIEAPQVQPVAAPGDKIYDGLATKFDDLMIQPDDDLETRARKKNNLAVLQGESGLGQAKMQTDANVYGSDTQLLGNRLTAQTAQNRLLKDQHDTRTTNVQNRMQDLFIDMDDKGKPVKGGANYSKAMNRLVGTLGAYGLELGDLQTKDLNHFIDAYDVAQSSDEFNNSAAGMAWNALLQNRAAQSRNVMNYNATAEQPGVFLPSTTRGVAGKQPNLNTYANGDLFGLPNQDLIARTQAQLTKAKAQ